jgi:ribosomal protein S27AE
MSNFWHKAVTGGQPAPRRAQTPYTPPPVQGASVAQPQAAQAPTKARSARETDLCPGCGSGNYFGTADSRKRCYDCGYPVEQSGYGAAAHAGEGQPARQITRMAKGDYAPGQVDRTSMSQG